MAIAQGAEGSPPMTQQTLTHRQVLIVFSGLMLVMLLAALDSTIVSTALPTIVGELGGLERLSWVVTAYLLAQTVVTPLYGKLGDIYGRKRVLQVGIVIFLVGSALCGMSQSMTQLILFRAVQGLGGGGLLVTTQAVVGDIVSPRERGRYQGIFGAVFGVSSVAGPLLGGYFTTQLSWRWIFYINLPLGVIALGVIALTLPAQANRVHRAIDYAGAGLLAAALSAIILVSDLGGTTYAWDSPPVIGLIVVALVALGAFLFAETRAAEPVLPLRLFRIRAFWVASAVGLIVGFALFGSVTYLPLYLQVVRGASPTASGLQMLPMMGGMLVSSIASGQIISRTGRYKMFPVVGTAVMTLGLFMLSRLSPQTSTLAASFMMLLLGLGLGMVMQVLVLAVQNAVKYTDLGVATSGATLFRLIGGSLGTAALGAIFAAQLSSNITRIVPANLTTQTVANNGLGLNTQMLAGLPAAVRELYAEAFTSSLGAVFLVATIIALIGFALTWLLPEHPLRQTVAATAEADVGGEIGKAFAMPTADADSLTQILRGLSLLADRDVRRPYIESIVARAGVDLSAAAAWLLVRLERDPTLDISALARDKKIEIIKLQDGIAELRESNLIKEFSEADHRGSRYELTEEGCAVLRRLVFARRERLAELFAEWTPEKREEIAGQLRRIARELVPEVHPNHAANPNPSTHQSAT